MSTEPRVDAVLIDQDLVDQSLVDEVLLSLAARRQAIVSWSFAAVVLALFFGYIGLIAFDAPMLRLMFWGAHSITAAIALGYAMIILTTALTGLFVIVQARYVQPQLSMVIRNRLSSSSGAM